MAGRAAASKAGADWPLLEAARSAERSVSSAKRGADHDLRVKRARQSSEGLLESLTDLERLRVACDELGGPAKLETFPSIPAPPPVGSNVLDWWESSAMDDWERQIFRAANRLEDITKADWKALLASLAPAMPGEQVLGNLESASPELKKACASIRKLVAKWETLTRKPRPEKGDAAAAESTAIAIADGWQALEEAGGAPERLDLLTRLSTQPPTITLADLTEEDWEWLLETELAGSVYLSIWED